MKELKDIYAGQVCFNYTMLLNCGKASSRSCGYFCKNLTLQNSTLLLVPGATPVMTLQELKEGIKETFYEGV